MNFIDAIKSAFRNYLNFSGRASRLEFWAFIIFALVAGNIITVLEGVIFHAGDLPEAGPLFAVGISIFLGPIASVFAALMIIPWVSVSTRRLHDIGRSGFWIYFGFIPPIGWLFMLIWLVREGDAGDNVYGPAPEADTPTVAA
ncbi:DUF805 domain-containing protein [Kordiimonas aquimaris]|uniref:DUF805 domain-containing protein n=1 Tax=Kordiimonas aquimaris TaxID=707591 RepID=UPI0021D1CE25|nr:DUF805 domain-containing protein [Kordiimonas aquimaris]